MDKKDGMRQTELERQERPNEKEEIRQARKWNETDGIRWTRKTE